MNKEKIFKILLTKSINIHYAKKYINFIFSRINQYPHEYSEKHHILPRANTQFPQYSNLSLYKWNGINLSAREHFIAHWMLWKAQAGFMAYAFKNMKRFNNKNQQNRYFKLTSKVYEELKRGVSKAQSNRVISQETRQKMSDCQKNRLKLKCIHCGILASSGNIGRWHNDNCKTLTGKLKHSINKTNKTKGVINPISGLNIHQQCGLNQRGDKNPQFKGYFLLNDKKFSTKQNIAKYCKSTSRAVDLWCKFPHRIISKKSYNNSSYLQSLFKYDELKNKTYYDIGFAFEPKTTILSSLPS